ncbi:MAG: fasciclin domain-containing protein [Opitutales bacterium]|nr:fasciclin domain-containing protein [Opitutales bacterium]
MKTTLTLLTTFLLAFAMPALFAGHHGSYSPNKDLTGILSENSDFSTLVAAVGAAGLVETLQGDGPFTVFAPTNEAFAALPEGTVESLLEPENRDQLIAILTYHVVAGKVLAKDVSAGMVETVNGSSAEITVRYGNVRIDGATVVATDLMASNGVIHTIDAVILP